MAIKYSKLQAERLAGIHSIRSHDRVTGWATWHIGPGNTVMEVLYARTWDGREFQTTPHVQTNEFNTPDRAWRPVSEIPEDAEFIGTYTKPSSIK